MGRVSRNKNEQCRILAFCGAGTGRACRALVVWAVCETAFPGGWQETKKKIHAVLLCVGTSPYASGTITQSSYQLQVHCNAKQGAAISHAMVACTQMPESRLQSPLSCST